MVLCNACHETEVSDGVNGDIYRSPPWAPNDAEPSAICYYCDNQALEDADKIQILNSINAATINGRFDCL